MNALQKNKAQDKQGTSQLAKHRGWYRTPPYCNVLSNEINNKVKYSFKDIFLL